MQSGAIAFFSGCIRRPLGNPGSPFPGLGDQLAFVHARQAAVVQQLLAANPQMLHAVAAAGIDQLRYRVVDRLLGQAGKIEGDHVGQLAQFQRAGLCFQSQCAGAFKVAMRKAL